MNSDFGTSLNLPVPPSPFKKIKTLSQLTRTYVRMFLTDNNLLLEHIDDACRVGCLLLSACFQFLLLFGVQWFLWDFD